MNKNLIYLGTVLVVLLVGLWGYYFYSQKTTKPSITPSKTPTSNQSPAASGVPNTNTSPATEFNDERSLLSYLDISNPSKEQTVGFVQAAQKFAKAQSSVTISSCQATPIVLEVKEGKEFNIVNADNFDIRLILAPKKQYSIPAGGTITVKADFGLGVHGYRCSGTGFENQPPAGFFSE